MIQHIGEVLAVMTVAFVAGSLIGWIAYRWIDRTDFAFDQRDFADAIGRLFGVRTPPPTEEPSSVKATAALVPVTVVRAKTAPADVPESSPAMRRAEREPWPEPIPILPGDEQPSRLEPVAKSEAAEDLRKRVQSSTRAIAWREARDERLRPGETAAQVVAGIVGTPASIPAAPAAAPEPAAANGKAPSDLPPQAESSRPRRDDATADHDEPWAPAPEVWPMDIRRLAPPEAPAAPLALAAPVPSEIRLALTPVATPPLAADDIWSDEDEPIASQLAKPVAMSPPPPEDRPPAIDGDGAEADNLRRIKGIGQGFEKRLNQLGIYRYAQIAAWTERQQAWVSAELGFPGRVERDEWPAQASRLGKGAEGRGSQAEVVRDP